VSVSITDRAAEAVQAEAERLGISQREIGRIIGKSQTAAWRRTSGEVPFSLAELEALAAAFGVPVARLLKSAAGRAA
jgi:transcriptional regulator with XRE-family HTH domain